VPNGEFKMSASKLLRTLYGFFSYSYCLIFIANKAGKEYGISHLKKLKIATRIIRNHNKSNALTTWQQHLLLVEEILRVPKSLKGDIVECGCYDGASTVNLSLACALTNRRLIVCDSFEGLPSPRDDEKYAIHSHSDNYYIWEEGEFSSQGGLDAVRRNIEKFGSIEVCTFVKGYFKDTLKDIITDSIVLVFEDADLASSVEDCLRYLWPKLQNDSKFYCHEPWSVDVVSLFYDKKWWMDNLKTLPPGFYGSGQGVMMDLRYYHGIGYAKKIDVEKIKQQGKKKIHAGSSGF
jgi:hypothetical protein